MNIFAKDITIKGDVVEDGDALADAVLNVLMNDPHVQVSFVDMRGLPSSFFNVLLKRLCDSEDGPQILEKIEFIFDSSAQEKIFARSKEAVLSRFAA